MTNDAGYVIELKNRRTGERFQSRRFESFESAARYSERLDDAEWFWSIEEA